MTPLADLLHVTDYYFLHLVTDPTRPQNRSLLFLDGALALFTDRDDIKAFNGAVRQHMGLAFDADLDTALRIVDQAHSLHGVRQVAINPLTLHPTTNVFPILDVSRHLRPKVNGYRLRLSRCPPPAFA